MLTANSHAWEESRDTTSQWPGECSNKCVAMNMVARCCAAGRSGRLSGSGEGAKAVDICRKNEGVPVPAFERAAVQDGEVCPEAACEAPQVVLAETS